MRDLVDLERGAQLIPPLQTKVLPGRRSLPWGTDDSEMLAEAWPLAAAMLADANREIARLQKLKGNALVTAWNASKARLWFGPYTPRRFRHIRKVYRRSRKKLLSGKIVFIRVESLDTASAFTNFGSRIIRLTDRFFHIGEQVLCKQIPPSSVSYIPDHRNGKTIVHEIVHTISITLESPFFPRQVEVYRKHALDLAKTNPRAAIHNADNFANYANELWIERVYKKKSANFRKCLRSVLYREPIV